MLDLARALDVSLPGAVAIVVGGAILLVGAALVAVKERRVPWLHLALVPAWAAWIWAMHRIVP